MGQSPEERADEYADVLTEIATLVEGGLHQPQSTRASHFNKIARLIQGFALRAVR